MKFGEKVDKAIDWMAARGNPQRMARRAHFRRMANDVDYAQTVFALLRTRGYRAAESSRNAGKWLGGDGSADTEILRDLPTLRNRSRELLRDDSIAKGVWKTFVTNVIGTGLRPQANTDDEEKNARIEAVFNERKNQLFPAEGTDFGSSQRLIFGKVLEDGDHFVKASKTSEDEPLWFESIEGDRCRWAPGLLSDKGNEIRDGVEKDAFKRPVAYWISKAPMNDAVSMGAVANAVQAASPSSFDRVSKDFCRHLKFQDRSGQTRGVPMFHAVMQDLRDLDLLLVAALKRTQIGACLAAFIKSDSDLNDILGETAKECGFKLEQEIEPGMIFKLAPGEDITTLIPNFPVPELVPFVIMIARKIGTALGISWQIVLKDFSQANYSSARTDLLESRATFLVMQDWFKENFLQPVWNWVMEDARLRGDPRLADVDDVELQQVIWIPNGWRWIDPVKEAQATQLQLQLGLTTLRDECAALGRDFGETLKQIAREQKALKEAGVVLPGLAGLLKPLPEEPEETPANRQLRLAA